MDSCEDNVADIERYAFLLGSALRGDDLEQFFCIYDSIIPKQLSEFQVDKIKERAREIADLAEGDFSQLVVKARDFSLAHAHTLPPPPSHTVAMRTSGQVVANHVSEKKEEDPPAAHPSDIPKLPLQHSSAFSPPCPRAGGMRDDDSGLPSSSSTNTGPPDRTSTSSDEALEMEERGAHDYFPQPTPTPTTSTSTSTSNTTALHSTKSSDQAEAAVTDDTKVKCYVSKSLSVGDMYDTRHYDEAVLVENDSDSIESPRSDASSGGSQSRNHLWSQEREGRPPKAARVGDGTTQRGNIHKDLYARQFPSSRKNVTRTRASSTSPIRPLSSRLVTKGLSSSPGAAGSSSFTSLAGGSSGQSRHSPDILETLSSISLSNFSSFMQGSSYNLSSKSVTSDASATAAAAGGAGAGAGGEGKKKKKKKKEARDDSGQEERSLIKQCDVNGNPLPPVSREQYLRLRQSSSTPHRASKEGGFSTNADSDPPTPKGESHGIGNKSEDPKNSSSILASRSSDKRKRKRNGGQAKPDEVAQNCPDYVGYLDLEFLVHYVNNGVSKKNLKLKKSGNPPAVGIDQGTMSTAVNEASHRSRASSKQLLTTGVGENSEDGLTPASETAQLVRSDSSFAKYLNINNHCSPQGASNHSLTEDQETGGSQVAAEESAEMGNYSASEQQKSVEMVPPKTLKTVKTYVSDTDLNAENGKVETPLTPNHIPPTAKPNKKAPSSGEGKDKSKVKNGGSTNNHKKDSAQNNDINQVNKKSRGKVPKSNIMAGNVQAPSTVVEKEKKMNGGVNATLPDDCDRTPLTVSPDLPVFQDSMIYTDRMFSNGLVTSAQEEEFTMVLKKKKKRTAQSRTSNFHAQTSSRSHSHKDFDLSFPSSQISSGTSYNPNRRWDSSYKPRVNPPPPPDSPTEFSKVERKEEEQDLSQSAFPALNRTDRSFQFLGPEARSLEDLACGVGQHSFDKDSDQASSKSLPAVQRSATRISYAVSYASMASAKTPRQSVDSSKATSMSSSTYDSNCEESAVAPTAAMKWKGSPQERRHSIGSAPEDLSKTVGSPSLQRTGSQEMLPRDSPEKSGRGLVSPVTVLASGSDSIDSTCTVVGADQENVHYAPVCPSSIPDQTASETGPPPQAVAPGSAAHSIPAQSVPGPLAPSGSLSVSSVISNPSANPLTSNPSKSRGPQPASSSRSQFAPGAAQNKANLTKPVNNENKRKCVIFCNDSPEANRYCSYRFGDLAESWIYEQFLMPSKIESASAPTCASEDSSATSGCVSPTRGLVTDTAAANPCGVSHASSNSTVSSDVPLLTSPQMPSGGKDTPSSSHSQTPLPIKASPGSASLKDQSAAGDSKAREGRVNVTNKADVGVSVRPLSTVKPEDPSVKGDNRVSSKPAKGCSVAGLNGVVQGLVVSQAAGADAHRSGTQVVSTPTLIPTKSSSNNPHAQPEGIARTDAAFLMEKGDAVLNQNSVSNQSDTAPSTGGNTQGAERSWCFPPATAKSSKQVYHSVQEAWEFGRQEMYDEAANFLSSGWRQAFEDGKKKDPEQIHVVPRPERM